MAVDFNVQGPCLIEVTADPEGMTSWQSLGYTDDDNRPSWRFRYLREDLFAQDTGREVAESVYTGSEGEIRFVLTKWNHELDDSTDAMHVLMNPPGATKHTSDPVAIQAGKVGTRWVTGGFTLGVRIVPQITAAGRKTYTSLRAIPIPDAFEIFELGNTSTRFGCGFTIHRNSEEDSSTIAVGTATKDFWIVDDLGS